ncbi:MAG TPA: hypothetical protein VF469_08405 [Kofleriaceae bacterium]
MPRYTFKPEDLLPLRNLLGRPDAQRILSRAIPVKVFDPPPAAVDVALDPLPVKLRTRNNPDGVPLGGVNTLVKERVPEVRSITVRDGAVLVSWTKAPTADMRAKLKAVLADKKAFEDMQSKTRDPPPMTDDELRTKLLANQTPDDEWLRSFRRYQVAKLAAEQSPKK